VPPSAEPMQRFRIWDLPTRITHWFIVLLFVILFATGQTDALPGTVHLWAGYLLLMVVLYRLAWGMVGSSSARFGRMMFGPRAVVDYMPRLFSRAPTCWPGHNPVGAWSSLLLLGLLLMQCVTGLFVESWAETRGPLAERVTRGIVVLAGDVHSLGAWLLLSLALVHVGATVYYAAGKGENRITGIFIDGRVPLPRDPGLVAAASWRIWLTLAGCVGAVLALVRLGAID
jgi:cytochrome b